MPISDPMPVRANFHESTHMRTACNTNSEGQQIMSIKISALALTWEGGELRIKHRLTQSTAPTRPRRKPGR